MNFKIPIIGAIISFVLLFIINLIAGNAFGIVLLRTLISTAIIFGLLVALVVVFKNVLGVDTAMLNSDDDSDSNPDVGQNLDVSVGDDSNEGSDGEIDTNDYNSDSAIIEDSPDSVSTDSFSTESSLETPFYDEGFDDVGTSGSNISGDTIKDKLGYDATTEDLAKAIRTIMPKDD